MFLLDIIIDLIINIYISLGFGTPERKINIKIEKVSKYHPEIMDLYLNNTPVFEKDPVLSQTILRTNIKNMESKRQLAEKINHFFTKGSY